MARQHPKIEALRSSLNELRQAPLFDKTVHAEQVAALSLGVLEHLHARLELVELAVNELRADYGRLSSRIQKSLEAHGSAA